MGKNHKIYNVKSEKLKIVFYSIDNARTVLVPYEKNLIFRYGDALRGWNEKGIPPLGGEFTSPIINNKPYSLGERALNKIESKYNFYYEIEVVKELPFSGEAADVIPWFGQVGNGKQMRWKLPIDPSTGFPKTWNKLAEEGYIRIIIKDSPSGKFKTLINTVIEK